MSPRRGVHIFASLTLLLFLLLLSCSTSYAQKEENCFKAGSIGSLDAFTTLPVTGEPWKVGNPVWNTWLVDFGDRYSTSKNGKHLQITFATKNVSLESGARFLSSPKDVFPSEEVTFRYKVYFKKGFNFVISGKLPGIFIGTYQEGYSTGKLYNMGQGSFRPTWQATKDGKKAKISPYMYGAHGSYDKALRAQGPATADAISRGGGRAGIHLWKDGGTSLGLKSGWNTIEIALKMNTPGLANGRVRMRVNQQVKTLDDVSFRDTDDTKIQSIAMECFFGGSSKYHMTPGYKQSLKMKDIQVRPVF